MVVPHHISSGEIFEHRYRIERELGSGAMGIVYEATQLSVGRRVAIKTLHTAKHVEAVHRKRFIREARIISQLEHPNTIRILDFGTTSSGHLYFVMEYLKGESLQDALKARKFSVADTIHVARQLGKSLAEAHARGIVHRDLKPANVYLKTVYGEPLFTKLLDFGIARDYEDAASETLTNAGFVVGTIRYMAPEQGRAEPLDGRADLYSLGCVMTEMLIGLARPNSELSIISQLKRIASGLPPEPFTIDSNDPRADALTALILQCRDPNPAMRPADAEAFVDRLDSLGTRGYVGTIPEPTIMMPVEALAHADETVIFEDNATNSIPLDASDHDTALTGQATITAKTSPEGTAPDRAATPVAGTPEHNPKTSRLRPLVIVALTSLCLMAALWTQYARSPEEPETTTETNSIESEGNTAQESSASVATSNHPSALVAAHPQKAPTAKTRIAPVSETPPIVIQPHANTAAPLAARIDQSQSTYRPQRRRRITTEITPFLRTVTVVTTPRSAVIRRAGKLLGTGTAAITWKSDEPGPKLTLTAPGFRTKTVTLGPDTKDEVTLTLRKSKQRVPVRDFYPLPK